MADLKGMQGQRFTLRRTDDWLDNAPAEAQALHGGVSAFQKVTGLRAAVITELNQKRIDRYGRIHEGAVQGVTELTDWGGEALREIETACTRMRQTGDPAEVIQIAIRRLNMLPRVVAAVEELVKDEEAANALVDMDVRDFQEQEIERFPALAQTLPLVSDEWLRNEPGAPNPRGGAS
jgi:hypothetical protein